MLKWNFFKSKDLNLSPIDFSLIKTDLHSHLIPAIDDGPETLETSVKIIKILHQLGFKKLITTPHVMSDYYKNTTETILNGLKSLQQEVKLHNINVQIEAAAEYYVDYEFEQKIGKEKFLTFGDKYILIELSFIEAPKSLHEVIFKLQLEGYKIILAHPERYLYFTEKDYLSLVRRGVFFQLNTLSLIDYYSSRVRKRAEHLINKQMISFIGSDCHNMKHACLYKKCQNKKSWHDLHNSNKLLNYIL